jgi:hypothetical protein
MRCTLEYPCPHSQSPLAQQPHCRSPPPTQPSEYPQRRLVSLRCGAKAMLKPQIAETKRQLEFYQTYDILS